MTTSTCVTCGRTLDEHDRHVRYNLPDPVLELPDREATAGTWMTAPNANESFMMAVPDVGWFVRALLPIRLTGGYSVTFGVWVGARPDDMRHAFEVWSEPEYADLRIDGLLANALPRWGLLGSPVELRVLDSDHAPYCVASLDPDLNDVLGEEWDHAVVLDSLAHG